MAKTVLRNAKTKWDWMEDRIQSMSNMDELLNEISTNDDMREYCGIRKTDTGSIILIQAKECWNYSQEKKRRKKQQ